MSGQLLFMDCFSGVAGDMFVGALLDLGVGSMKLLERELAKLGLEGWSMKLERVTVSGVSGSKFNVEVEEGQQEPRSLAAIEEMIAASKLSEAVRSHCLAIFGRVARAEAGAHGETLQTVHFHEVGMVDSIIDIVSTCILIEELSPREILGSPVALGAGRVKTMHGDMPVPAPATAILLKGIPVFQGVEQCELATPTGAALISYFVDSFGPLPPVRIDSVGYGAGTRKTNGPNLLRCITGERVGVGDDEEIEQQVLLETNIDDSTPEQLAYLTERLMAEGAADAWLTPVIMKKGRPGVVLSVLSAPGHEEKFLDLLFTESSTFGVRVGSVERHCLKRRQETVETRFGAIRVKIGSWHGLVVAISPEYEDCKREAAAHGVPLSAVYKAAREAVNVS